MNTIRPSDFGSFWYELGKDLADIPASPEIEAIPMRSTDFADLYGVRITSIGPYRLYGFLSIPKSDGPVPAIYYTPKNASVLEIIPQGTSNAIRGRYVTFSLACRGMRNSDKPYAAMYPGQLTDGIHDPESYVYRGIVADTMRGLDFLMSRPEVDRNAVVAWGNDNALLAAALHDSVTHVVTTPAYLLNTIEMAERTSAYPLEEFNDYIRRFPERRDQVENILNYYNLKWHAQSITATTLVMADHESGLYSPQSLSSLVEGIAGEATVHESERSSFRDGLFAEKWITENLIGEDADPLVPAHWQE